MSRSKHTRRHRKPALTQDKTPAPRRITARRQLAEFHDALRVEAVHARAITMTAALALQGAGVHDDVSVALRGAVRRLDIVLESLDEKGGRSHG